MGRPHSRSCAKACPLRPLVGYSSRLSRIRPPTGRPPEERISHGSSVPFCGLQFGGHRDGGYIDMTPLSLDLLEEARAAILENARSLVADAQTLLAHQRYARAFALTVLGREELGKLAMIVPASYAVAAGENVDWNPPSQPDRESAGKTAEPAHVAPGEEHLEQGPLPGLLDHPQQL